MSFTSEKVKKTLGSLTSTRKTQPSLSQTPRNRLKQEIEEYTKIPTKDGDDDPFNGWKCHFKKIQLLSQVAQK